MFQESSYFGPLKVSKDYVGESVPALLTNIKENHPEVRAYMIDALRERAGGAQKAFTHASENFYADLKENGESSCGFRLRSPKNWPQKSASSVRAIYQS